MTIEVPTTLRCPLCAAELAAEVGTDGSIEVICPGERTILHSVYASASWGREAYQRVVDALEEDGEFRDTMRALAADTPLVGAFVDVLI